VRRGESQKGQQMRGLPESGTAEKNLPNVYLFTRYYAKMLSKANRGHDETMRISQKGLYALQAMMMLARRYEQGAVRIRDIAYEEALPEKFLELILLELKNARMLESVRGAKGGYKLRRPPSEIYLAEIIRLIDGALAPFADAEGLRNLIENDVERRALYQVFLDVRDAAAKILENTSLADLVKDSQPQGGKTRRKSQKQKEGPTKILPMTVHAKRAQE